MFANPGPVNNPSKKLSEWIFDKIFRILVVLNVELSAGVLSK